MRRLSWKQQAALEKSGYAARIQRIDQAIRTNQRLVSAVVDFAKQTHALSYTDLKLPVEPRDNFRVIETLCHYQRDWTAAGDPEIRPILEYVQRQCARTGLDPARTLAIVPGSGLGRVAHEMATSLNFQHVHAVEYAMVMKCFHEFIYSDEATYTFHPYLHSYSNQVSTAAQLRPLELRTLGTGVPSNLTLNYADFNKFEVPDIEKYDNVVVCTVFFMDTAENLFQYLESIERLTSKARGKKVWINAGPLKYGSRPRVELNLQELLKLVKHLGWNVTDQQDPKLLGYLTDLQSMWQGQYGVSMFTCERK